MAAALTAKSLLVTDYAQFAGPINAKDLTADNLTSRNNLTVVGDSFVGGNELVKGNLKVAGTLQAGHTEFSSLGVTGQLGAGSLSAGSGGLVVGGNANFNGDSNLFAGGVTINNILNINKETPAALTVGDGVNNIFTVNTKDDVVTIAATLNLSGNTQYSGNMDLSGALDLDTASTSALTVGDGAADNFIIDTVNDILTLGYSSTTDQINVNAKQLALNFASSTAGLLINYDGAGNIIQIVDNGVNRFILSDSGNLIQTASTTGYAYVLNQAGTNGSLLDVQDQGTSRFTIADLGVINLTASSTTGTALTVRQDGAGDILNLFDADNEVLTVLGGGNLGLGTTSPNWLLQAAGTRPFFTLSDTGASANLKHWFLSSQGGNFYIGTSSDALATSTISALTINSNGYVGIATTSPAVNFAVGGHCVTGDTRLRRRRRKSKVKSKIQNEDEEYIYDEVQIKDIEPGDEIASLDESTGKIVWSRVNGLLDMGVKEIYKLTTASGKQIRTTAEHPYLAEVIENNFSFKQSSTVFEVDQSNRIEELNRDSFISIANKELAVTVKIPAKVKKELYKYHRAKYRSKFGFQYFANAVAAAARISNFKITDLVIDFEYPGRERDIIAIIKRFVGRNSFDVYFKSIGKKSPAHNAAYTANTKRLPVNAILNFEQTKTAAVPYGAKELLRHGVVTVSSQSTRPYVSIIDNKQILSSAREWTKVIYLKKGQRIAVSSENGVAVWDKIVKIEILPPEQVYDIEVEGTHNFIGNDIVAHNTYITGGLGVGQVETTAGNITGTGRLAITGASATSTLAGGLAIETSGFVYDWQTNNVGIGTAGPGQKLHVEGTDETVIQVKGTSATGNGAVFVVNELNNTLFLSNRGSTHIGTRYGLPLANMQFLEAQKSSAFVVGTNSNSAPLVFGTGGFERVRIDGSSGNLGLGTTSPNWLLQAAGTRPFFTLSDTGAAANLKHWFLSSQGGNFYIGTSSDALATSTISALTINANGYVGIATTSPAVNFAVGGHCVTGDTRLRRRRKSKVKSKIQNEDEEYIYDEVQIKDIEPGDEIASLDEKTGKIVWSRVNGLLDMGIKTTYRFTTEDGRQIRTTAEHPYLVKDIANRAPKHKSEIADAGWLTVSDIKQGDYIAAPKPRVGVFIDDANIFYAQKKADWRIDYKKLNNLLAESFEVKFMNYYLVVPDKKDAAFKKTEKFLQWFTGVFGGLLTFRTKQLKYIYDKETKVYVKKGNVDSEVILDVMARLEELDVVIIASGDSDYKALAETVLAKGKKVIFAGFENNMAWELRQMKHIYLNRIKEAVELGENKKAPEKTGVPLLSLVYSRQEFLSSPAVDNQNDFIWSRVKSIEKVAEEQVYDIEVAGTHNFIGNDIVAHNTYITGGLGVGQVETTAGNITGTGRLAITGASATSTLAGGLAIETSGLVYDWQTNNVGIGTAAPNYRLKVYATNAENINDYLAYIQNDDNGTYASGLYVDTPNNSNINGKILSLNSGGSNKLVALATGNVGIGTTSPGSLLSVAGNGLFNGSLTAYGGFSGSSITATSSLTISASDTASSSVNNLLTLEHLSSASGGLAGIGSAILFNAEDTGGSSTSTARILSALSSVSTSSPASYLAFETKNTTGALTERLRLDSNGNLGIGTTSPLAKLSVQGTAGSNIFDVASSTGQSLLTINNIGQCVTGDTKLRRRRKRKKGTKNGDDDGEADKYVYDEVMIKDIMPGDEIASLDERTGKIVWSRVNALMDMGVKGIYKLTTALGKQIRTTANHPYFARERHILSGRFEVDQSGRLEDLSADSYIAIAANDFSAVLAINKKLKREIFEDYKLSHRKKYFGPAVWARTIAVLLARNNIHNSHIVLDLEYKGYEQVIKQILKTFSPDNDFVFTAVGKKSPAHKAAYEINKKPAGAPVLTREAMNALHPKGISRPSSSRLPLDYQTVLDLSRGKWIKVTALRPGMEIAILDTGNSLVWDRISRIEILSEEQVYDIEVEGTHNFVGNDIIAHNTYISGNLGIGTTSPYAKLSVAGRGVFDQDIRFDYFTATSTSATSTLAGGLAIETSGLVYDWQTNNVGIGTAGPDAKLRITANSDDISDWLILDDTDSSSGSRTPNIKFQNNSTVLASIRGHDTFGLQLNGGTGSNQITINSSGNLGIGTTTPNWLLQAAGTRPFFTLSDTGASANLKHWFLSSQGGNFYVGTSSDALATSTISALTINANGFVGIATTSPAVNFAVAGHCVTGDTRLRRRRKRRNKNGVYKYEYDEVQIKDIKPGDEIASLDEKTGQIVWSRVNGLLDMGIKEIYKLTTASGKTIRTTENHPYYLRYEDQKTLPYETELLERGGEQGSRTPSAKRRTFYVSNSGAPASALLSNNRRNENYNMNLDYEQNKNASIKNEDVLVGPFVDEIPLPDTYLKNSTLLKFVKSGDWVKVKYLKVGQEIAVAPSPLEGEGGGEVDNKAVWDKIVKIEILLPEQVYDIEVAGTHNFIGNDIVAHNTYITGGLGVGTTETTNGNITGTGRLAITGASATSTLAGGLAIETSGLVYDWQTNNVGIGTAGPGAKLEVNGDIYLSPAGARTIKIPTVTGGGGSSLTIAAGGAITGGGQAGGGPYTQGR